MAGNLIPFVWVTGKLCDLSLTHAIRSALEVSYHEKALHKKCPVFNFKFKNVTDVARDVDAALIGHWRQSSLTEDVKREERTWHGDVEGRRHGQQPHVTADAQSLEHGCD